MASCCCEIAGSFFKEETKKIKLLHFENIRVTLHRNKLLKDEKEFFIYHCISVAG